MKHLISGLLCGIIWVQSALPLAAESRIYQEPDFSNAEPVRMEILQDGGRRKLGARFVRPSSTGVEIEMLDGDGAIIVGWDHMEQFTINIPITEKLNRALSHRDPKRRVELLENEVRPLLPLASIRSESTNVHILLNAYIEAVIASEDWLRGYEMSQNMALNRSPAETVQHLYTVAENLFVVNEQAKALTLIDQLTAARPAKEFRKLGRGVAERMLDLRLFEPALRLYLTIADATTGLESKKALYVSAYLSLEMDDAAEAEGLIQSAKAIPQQDNEAFGLEYLCQGVEASRAGEADLALKHLGHAMVLLPTRNRLQQVGLYYTYQSYWGKEQVQIAQNILDEMSLLFPDSAYLATLEQSIITE
ncbi:hypothetical protein SH580_05535 [Coraliomargarita algicola]|uniref:Tetratricopeptide repeat protein n=1 Tax=Coraliomargarita algicola TaxID=3092156 RepID=A0ABZ0RLT4_9BACT|nr:hypothetical protein [Coraliomargarita sp. J2-16]WPJ97169.1 hypothetical protein SH580_05535 [Coraliomargarita sp. J2-16]